MYLLVGKTKNYDHSAKWNVGVFYFRSDAEIWKSRCEDRYNELLAGREPIDLYLNMNSETLAELWRQNTFDPNMEFDANGTMWEIEEVPLLGFDEDGN